MIRHNNNNNTYLTIHKPLFYNCYCYIINSIRLRYLLMFCCGNLGSLYGHSPYPSPNRPDSRGRLEEDIQQLISISIAHQQPLRLITLPYNNLSELIPSNIITTSLSTLPHLTGLYLNNNQLLYLPNDIGLLSNLQRLSLHHNKLSLLPFEIGRLSLLVELSLSNNELLHLPTTITLLTNLHSLHVQNNKLSTIPLEIGNLPLLKYLYCYSNPLLSPLDDLGRETIETTNLQNHCSRALSRLKACLEGTTKYRQVKLVLIGNRGEGKVFISLLMYDT